MALRFLTCLALMVCIVASVDAEISCLAVEVDMYFCTTYLQRGGEVPPSCCAGVKRLNSMAKTTADRQQTCRCLQSASKLIPGLSPTLSASLPGKCGVTIPYPISMTVDCSTIK